MYWKKSLSVSIGALGIEQEVFGEEVKLKSPHHFKDFAGTEALHRSKCGKKSAYGTHCCLMFFSLIVSLSFSFPFCFCFFFSSFFFFFRSPRCLQPSQLRFAMPLCSCAGTKTKANDMANVCLLKLSDCHL